MTETKTGDEREIRDRALAIAEDTLAKFNELRPAHLTGLTQGQDVVYGLDIRARNLFRGICLLGRAGLCEEAHILSRTLLEDIVTLNYFQLRREEIEILALRFLKKSISEELGLIHSVAETKSPQGQARIVELKDQQQRVNRDLVSRGQKPKSLPGHKAMLEELEQMHVYGNFKLASMSVHTSRLALESARKRQEDGVSVWSDECDDGPVASIAFSATHSFVTGALAAADLLSWERSAEARSLYETAAGQLDQLSIDAGWVNLSNSG